MHYNSQSLNKEEFQLWLGVENHYADDSFFHSMSLFKQGMISIEEEMHKNLVLKELRRKYLISHVLYELILDHLILERFPDIAENIYADLEQVDISKLGIFLKKIIGENEKVNLFLDSYDRFLDRRFLGFYGIDSNLVKSLHMVSGKISQWDFNKETINGFTAIIRKMKKEIDFKLVFESIFKHKEIR
ncbi:MAG: hypothetical protein ACK5UE_07465 [Chitinophagales bacterium]|nr:hypothetical protein [Sphingobacteriales bacterium]